MGKKHKKEKHHRHEGEKSLKLVLKVPAPSPTPASLPSAAKAVPHQPPIPILTLPTGLGALGGDHQKKKKKKKKSQQYEDGGHAPEPSRKKHKSSSVPAPLVKVPTFYPPVDEHGMPIGEPPALIPADSVKPKHSRRHQHHRRHHEQHLQPEYHQQQTDLQYQQVQAPLPPITIMSLPPSEHHRHGEKKKKKSKKRRHEEDALSQSEPPPPEMPAKKKIKIAPVQSPSPAAGRRGSRSNATSPSAEPRHLLTLHSSKLSPRVISTNASPTAAQLTSSARPASSEPPAAPALSSSALQQPSAGAAAAVTAVLSTASSAAGAAATPSPPPSVHPVKLKGLLTHVHKLVRKKDTHDFFLEPVCDDFAPGYSQIIKKPMDLETMQKKIDGMAYQSITEYQDDFERMCHNCMTYNAPDTIYYKAASTLLKAGLKIITRDRSASLAVPAAGGGFTLPADENSGPSLPQSPIGQQPGDLTDTGMPAPIDPFLSPLPAEKIKKKRPSVLATAAQTQRRLAAEITRQAEEVAAKAALRVKNKKIGVLEKDEDGQVRMRLFNPDHQPASGGPVRKLVDIAPPPPTEKPATKPSDSKRRSAAVLAITNGPFSSFAPVYDSTFSMLSPEESDLLYSTYGNQPAFHYAQSLRNFVKDLGPASFGLQMVDMFLNHSTEGGHDKCLPVVKRCVNERDKKMNKPETLTLTQQKKIERVKKQAAADEAAATAAAEAAKAAAADADAADKESSEKQDKDTSENSAADEEEPEGAQGESVTMADIRSLEKLGIDVSFLDPVSSTGGDHDATGVKPDAKEGINLGTAAGPSASSSPALASPSIVLHSPASDQESDLALLNKSLHEISADSLSAVPSAAASPSAAGPSDHSPSTSGMLSSEASPSASGSSSPGLPSLSAMLDRQLEEGDSGSEKNDEDEDEDEEVGEAMDDDRSVPCPASEREPSASQAQLDDNASRITQLVGMQSERFIAVAQQSSSSGGVGGQGSSAGVSPTGEEHKAATELASGLTQLASKVAPAVVVPTEGVRTALGLASGDSCASAGQPRQQAIGDAAGVLERQKAASAPAVTAAELPAASSLAITAASDVAGSGGGGGAKDNEGSSSSDDSSSGSDSSDESSSSSSSDSDAD